MKVNDGDKPFVLSGIIYAGLFVLLGMSSSSYAVLTASTANTIQGTAPGFKTTSGANKLGFVVNGTFYSEHSGNIASGEDKTFSGYLSLSDFAVKSLATTDFTVVDDYLDGDNDGANSTTPFSVGTTSYSWQDASGAEIPQTAYSNMIGCGSGYSMPLTLTIKMSNVQVHSEYGDPRSSAATTLTKSYQINIDSYSGVCYVKPNSMVSYPETQWVGMNATGVFTAWNNMNNTSRHIDNGGGYSPDFVPNQGFKAGPTVSANAFPTTGFPGARFQLVMSGAQTDYSYTVPTNPGSGVVVDATGFVTLNSKPTGAVTVRATLKTDTSVFHDYTFNPTMVWAVPQTGTANWATSSTKCGGATNVLTRAELTNSPRNVSPQGWDYVANYYTRAIDGSIFGEWGRTDNISYPSSQWADSYYWTQDIYTTEYSGQFIVHSYSGPVYYAGNVSIYIACRG